MLGIYLLNYLEQMTYRKIAKEIKHLALDLLQCRMPVEDVCDLLLLHPRSVRRWRSNIATFGDVEPPARLPQGRPPIIPSEVLDLILVLIQGEPSTYLEELQVFLSGEFNIAISVPALHANLQRAGMTHKKLTTLAKERNEINRDHWWQ
jgi:transposase